MNLYLLSQTVNDGYDTYDSVVVAAETPENAIQIHPNETKFKDWTWEETGSWVDELNEVSCNLIGKAVEGTEEGVILASFRAG